MNIETLETFTTAFVKRVMPHASARNIEQYWHSVYMALDECRLSDKHMLLMALGTIAAEAGNFDITVREYVSKWNTSPEGKRSNHLFDLYDNRSDLGNTGRPDGFLYRGGGAIQLTGRWNYRDIGRQMGVPLEDQPDLIENPIISARALALFLKNKEEQIRMVLANNDLRKARRLVNGGSHGLSDFSETYTRGLKLAGGE